MRTPPGPVHAFSLASLLVFSSRAASAQSPPPDPALGEAAPEGAPPDAATPVAPQQAAPPAAAKLAAEPAEAHWYDKIALEAFVDAYVNINYNFPKPQAGTTLLRAYEVNQGFALHWVGLNASFAPDPVGATVGLRFGPSALIQNTFDAPYGLGNVKQAFVSFKPGGAEGRFTVDFGKFDSPVGSELSDSQTNMNYTRSALFWLSQPGFFTGFRLAFAATKAFEARLFAVNGWNNSIDMNRGKTGALQLNFKPVDAFAAALTYVIGPEQADSRTDMMTGTPKTVDVPNANKNLRHLIDLVLDIKPTDCLRALVNANFGLEDLGTEVISWYGANVGVRYAATEKFSVALRGEYYGDPDGYTTLTGKNVSLIEGTLTLGYNPTRNLLLKLDQRVDFATTPVFPRNTSDLSKTQITTTLGVVGTTN